MGLIEDADRIIEQERQRKQAAEREKQRRFEPVDPSHYAFSTDDETRGMLAEFVQVMHELNISPSPCVVANANRTFTRTRRFLVPGISFTEAVTLSLTSFGAWCIKSCGRLQSRNNYYDDSYHSVGYTQGEPGYAVTERCELALIIPLIIEEAFLSPKLAEYFPGYADKASNSSHVRVFRVIDNASLEATSISIQKADFPYYDIQAAGRPAIMLNSMNVLGCREPWHLNANSTIDSYEVGIGESASTYHVTLRQKLLDMIVDVKRASKI